LAREVRRKIAAHTFHAMASRRIPIIEGNDGVARSRWLAAIERLGTRGARA
jgi:hypothetical protein